MNMSNLISKAMPHAFDAIDVKALKKRASGKAVLGLLESGIQNGLLQAESVEDYLSSWRKIAHKGSCAGQGAAVMIASKDAVVKSEKQIVEKADLVDAASFQIFSDLRAAIDTSLMVMHSFIRPRGSDDPQYLARQLKGDIKNVIREIKGSSADIDESLQLMADKITKLPNSAFAEIRREYNQLIKLRYRIINGFVGVCMLKPELEKIALKYIKEIKAQRDTVLSESADLKCVTTKKFWKKDKQKLMQFLKSLQGAEGRVAVKFTVVGKKESHAVTFFMAPFLSIYDAMFGMTRHENIEDFLKTVEKLYCDKDNYVEINATEYVLEVFKE